MKTQILIFFALFSFALKGKVFTYCAEGTPSSFNPQLTTDGTTSTAVGGTIYNRLVSFERGTTKIIPSLALKWKFSNRGKRLEFTLRKDIKFHTTSYFRPTRNMNADDVVFSIKRQLDSTHAFHQIGGGIYPFFKAMEMDRLILSIKKRSQYVVSIELAERNAPFLANMAMDFMSIQSKEYANLLVKKNQRSFIDTYPIGTGPFSFLSYEKNKKITYQSFKNYFKGAPKFDRLIFDISKNPMQRFEKLKKGYCQLMTNPPKDLFPQIKVNPKLKIISSPGLNIAYLAFNIKVKPFNNLNIRKAITYALNRKSYIKTIFNGHALLAKNPIPPSMWSYNHGTKRYEYSPEKARKYLKLAGYPTGFEATLWTLPIQRPYNPNGELMGQMMKKDLARVGIRIKLKSYRWKKYKKLAKLGKHQMIQLGWTGDNGDPDNFMGVLLGCPAIKAGTNIAFWCHFEFTQLIAAAKKTSSYEKRRKYYFKAQEIFKARLPWVPLAHSKIFKVMSKGIQGFIIDPFGVDHFENIEIR